MGKQEELTALEHEYIWFLQIQMQAGAIMSPQRCLQWVKQLLYKLSQTFILSWQGLG
jgi:hypothetical protein